MNLQDSTVLVTGGTGSFGHAFCERLNARKLVVFSRDELKQHEMRQQFPDVEFFIGDVRDYRRLLRALRGVDIVVHAAALKQVPAGEFDPDEFVATNVGGSRNVRDAAIECGVKRVVALSSDKACNPINLYGATKLCMEKLMIQGNHYAAGRETRFSCVRYGNVLGSRGSVLPMFLKQRDEGKLTVTHPEMTRFWMTLDDAVSLVVDAIEWMRGGEIFVPMAKSMSLVDMVRAIAPDAEIEFTGIRPGEKLHEILISEDEARHTHLVNGRFVIRPEFKQWGKPDPASGQIWIGGAYRSDTAERMTAEEMLGAI